MLNFKVPGFRNFRFSTEGKEGGANSSNNGPVINFPDSDRDQHTTEQSMEGSSAGKGQANLTGTGIGAGGMTTGGTGKSSSDTSDTDTGVGAGAYHDGLSEEDQRSAPSKNDTITR